METDLQAAHRDEMEDSEGKLRGPEGISRRRVQVGGEDEAGNHGIGERRKDSGRRRIKSGGYPLVK